MTEGPQPPPEGLLIMAAAKKLRISQREAARRADVSETWWRRIVSGYQLVNKVKVPTRGVDETLARMARGVGVSAEQLEAVDRAGAAEALRRIEAEAATAAEKERRDADAALRSAGARTRVEERWHMLEPVLLRAPVDLDPFERDDLRGRVDVLLARSPEWHAQEPAPAPKDRDPENRKSPKGRKSPRTRGRAQRSEHPKNAR
ncbi:Helix-turn-helix domain-containing protein [Actinacidiphila yanglinensis]|uniref:Helix-turn-helix domain-containing protein n=1 Tax=Actinacidiphila yanglinensis TaxID=310779 RepID=A0A1H6AG37_9ACTN|nr:helix-turn-helix transcriptional regulator [Actinacidiphila yanglinensis]SEG47739.1 Helix-turn-helix domain-containing protein [Actinacidiphila yanglinensis]